MGDLDDIDEEDALELGRIAYLAYGAACGWKHDDGADMPEWDDLDDDDMDRWVEVAAAVAAAACEDVDD